MRGEVLGAGRWRRWRDDEKLAIVSSVGIDGAPVTQVAQRREVARQQIYAWRHERKKKGLWSLDAGAIFLPVDLPALQETPREVEPVPPVSVELRLAGGWCLRVDSAMDAAVLTRRIRAGEKA